ncbi:MAG: M57 family metalloprotease, partial [Pseudomonadota bacterium]
MERLSLLDQLFGNPDWLSDLLGRKVDTIWDTTPTALFTPAATTPGQWAAAVSDMLVDNGLLPIGSDDHGRGCGCLGCSGLRDIDIDAQREAASQGQRDGTAVAAEYGVGTIDPSIAFAAQGAIPDPTPGQDPNAATLGEMADFLRADYWNGTSFKYNLGDSGPNPNNGVITYNVSGFSNKAGVTDSNGISGARGNLVREAFKVFEAVLGIEFVETTSANADFFFADNQGGAYASSRGFQNGLEYTLINVASNWSGGTSTYNDYTLQTIFHEIGHGLGLGHQGYYNGSGGWPNDAVFVNDSWQGSMMSYFSQIENQAINATGAYLQTPMAVDWLALDALYGGDQSGGKTFGIQNAFKGDTVYGFNTNINSSVSDIWAKFADYADRTASTIIDGDGIDTLDVSGYSADQKINLKVATASDVVATVSDIGGLVGNLTLAVGTVIENAVGGSGDDQFWGNATANQFVGNGGNDTFYDSEGSDEYRGGSGTDTATFGFDFADYSFQVAGSFLEVVHVSAQATIDLVENTVEWLSFADQTV